MTVYILQNLSDHLSGKNRFRFELSTLLKRDTQTFGLEDELKSVFDVALLLKSLLAFLLVCLKQHIVLISSCLNLVPITVYTSPFIAWFNDINGKTIALTIGWGQSEIAKAIVWGPVKSINIREIPIKIEVPFMAALLKAWLVDSVPPRLLCNLAWTNL